MVIWKGWAGTSIIIITETKFEWCTRERVRGVVSARTQEEKRGCFVFAARIAQLHCLLYEALFLITGPKGNSDFCYPETHVPSGKAKVNFGSGRNCKKNVCSMLAGTETFATELAWLTFNLLYVLILYIGFTWSYRRNW